MLPLHVKVGVPKEIKPGERRVALVPDVAGKLVDAGFEVLVEAAPARRPISPTSATPRRARRSCPTPREALRQADVVPKVAAPEAAELEGMREGAVLIGFLSPLTNPDLVKRLAERARHELRDGGDPAHDPRAVDGRAVLAGGGGRLPRDARRRARCSASSSRC